MLRRSGCVLCFFLKYPCMTINDIIYSILIMYILLLYKPLFLYVDGTIIDSSTIILVTMYYYCG